MTVTLRLMRPGDAGGLAALYRANRAFLAPWEPFRDEEFFSDQFQHDLLTRALSEHAAGHSMPFMIVNEGTLAGRISLTDIVRGAFQSAHLGYWVARDHNGHGVASAAVAKMVEIAFDDLGLHQLEAGTLTQNAASQRVLTKNGFERIGLASEYLHHAGRWQDHILFQRINRSPTSVVTV